MGPPWMWTQRDRHLQYRCQLETEVVSLAEAPPFSSNSASSHPSLGRMKVGERDAEDEYNVQEERRKRRRTGGRFLGG